MRIKDSIVTQVKSDISQYVKDQMEAVRSEWNAFRSSFQVQQTNQSGEIKKLYVLVRHSTFTFSS